MYYPQYKCCFPVLFEKSCNYNEVVNITIELMFAGINMFLARLRLILARAQRGLK